MEPSSTQDFSILKVLGAWGVLAWGWITLSNIALLLTIAFTALQIYKTVSEMREKARAKLTAAVAAAAAEATLQAITAVIPTQAATLAAAQATIDSNHQPQGGHP